MTAGQLYIAYMKADEEARAAEVAEAEARLKKVKTRRAAEAAEMAYDAKLEAYSCANLKAREAYQAWQEARNVEAHNPKAAKEGA